MVAGSEASDLVCAQHEPHSGQYQYQYQATAMNKATLAVADMEHDPST